MLSEPLAFDANVFRTAATPTRGYLWDNAYASGVSYRDYGLYTTIPATAPAPATSRRRPTSTTRASGTTSTTTTPASTWTAPTTPTGCRSGSATSAPTSSSTPGPKRDPLPKLTLMRLPNDHTYGTSPAAPTPQAYMADNDLALGRLVEIVSHSAFWKHTAIFVTEDDSQNGPDHVDAHRTLAYVISPYTQTGAIDSTQYDTAGMVATIEDILGLPPMSITDQRAVRMWNGFERKRDMAPYTALMPSVVPSATPDAQRNARPRRWRPRPRAGTSNRGRDARDRAQPGDLEVDPRPQGRAARPAPPAHRGLGPGRQRALTTRQPRAADGVHTASPSEGRGFREAGSTPAVPGLSRVKTRFARPITGTDAPAPTSRAAWRRSAPTRCRIFWGMVIASWRYVQTGVGVGPTAATTAASTRPACGAPALTPARRPALMLLITVIATPGALFARRGRTRTGGRSGPRSRTTRSRSTPHRVPTMRILVVGAGGVGGAAAAIARRRGVLRAHRARRHLDRPRARPRSRARATTRASAPPQVDASDRRRSSRSPRAERADVILNACDPRLNPPIFAAAFDAGCTYLDMAMTLSRRIPSARSS